MSETNPTTPDPASDSAAPPVGTPGGGGSGADRDPEAQLHQAEAKVDAIERARGQAHPGALSASMRLGLLAAVGLLAVGWHRTFYEMWFRWFPAWRSQGSMGLMERFTEGDSYYSHGPLVPLTSLVIAYFIFKRVGFPIRRSRGASVLGWALLLVFLAFHLLSVSPSARVMFVSGYALIGVLGGLMLVWGGWPLAKAYWMPVVFLVFMVPMPEVAIVDLNFRLKFLAGRAALWLTNHVFAVPAVMDGSYVYLTPDELGNPKMLVIENVCSGLRSLISLVWFASLFAMVCRVKGLWRLVMLAMAVPVAVACNVVRITSLNIVAHYFSVDAAGPKSAFHDLSGLLVFGVALGMLFGLEQLVIVLNKWMKRDWVDHRLLGFLESMSRLERFRSDRRQWAPLAVLGVTAGLSLYWGITAWGGDENQKVAAVVPETITVEGQTFVGRDHKLDEKSLTILEYPDYLYRRYTDPQTGQKLDLLIVFSANNRKGTHPPEVCIEGGGSQITERRLQSITVGQIGELSFQELLAQRSRRQDYFLYVYKAGGRYTPSFFSQQFWIFVNGLMARSTAGALIRLSVPVGSYEHEVGPSRQLAMSAAAVLLPEIHEGLP